MTPALAVQEWIANASLEELVTSPHFFGLDTASPVQRAFCRVADGVKLGELADDPAVQRALGHAEPDAARPLEVSWLAAIRCAKSLTAAAGCVRMSQCVQLPKWLKPGDIPRIPILSLDLDKAEAVMNHLANTIVASPLLKMIVLDNNADGLVLRHPTGKQIVVKVVAGKRAGNAVVAYWLAGCIFDEYGKMHGESDAVVNWDDTRNGAIDRILPGGQVWNIGSPWAPEGPAHKQYVTSFGKPTARLVVMSSPGWDTNPTWWTPGRVEDARVNNPNFRTDVEAKFGTPEESFFSADQILESTRALPRLEPQTGASYVAFIDPATRGNAFTLVIATREGNKMRVALAAEWVGSKDAPLDTGTVLDDIAALCRQYGVTSATTDQYMGDALASQARERGFTLVQWTLSEPEKVQRALCFRTKLGAGEVELCPVTTWRAGQVTTTGTLALDMQRVRRQLTQAAVVVKLPLTTDGRHCDFAPPIIGVMGAYLADVKEVVPQGNAEQQRMREAAQRRYGAKRDEDDE